MAITVQGKPDKLRPVYNPIVFYVSSTNVAQEGFKYVVDVYYAGTSNRIGTSIKLFPRPGDQYGVVDLNQLLQSEVTYFIDQTLQTTAVTPENFVNYDVKFGEEYVNKWAYTSKSNNAGKLRLIGPSGHGFTNGDIVNIEGSGVTPSPNGNYKVLFSTATTVTLDLTYSASFDDTGIMQFANGQKTVYPALTTLSDYTAFNGAVKYQELSAYNGEDYDVAGYGTYHTGKFLTNAPNDNILNLTSYRVRKENDIWLNYYSSNMAESINVFVTTDNITNHLAYSIPASSSKMRTINVGVDAIIAALGSSAIFTGKDWYQVWVTDEYDVNISEFRSFRIEDFCSRYENVELYFQDRLGSIMPANFQLQSYRNNNISRTEYNKYLGNLVNPGASGKWDFDSTARGRVVLNTQMKETLALNSNWLTEEEAYYLRELYSSPVVFIKENGKLWPVIIQDTSYAVTTKNNKKMIRNTITVQYAVDSAIQQGY